MLEIIAGVDLCEVEGISQATALELLSETGTDMSKWRNSKHFAAWLNVAPNTKITGGKIISSKMQRKKNHAGLSLRMAASTLSKAKSAMGDYSRKMKSRLGKRGGVVATAHKLARIVYTMLQEKQPYKPELIVKSRDEWKQKRIKYLEKQLEQLRKVA